MVLLFLRQGRVTNNNGGTFVDIKDDNIKCRVLEELSRCQDHEILWLHLRPTHLPRGVSCLIAAVVYHPPGADDNSIRDHLFHSLALAESKFPNYGIIVAGDFNRLNITMIRKHFRLKRIIKSPTRKDVILDLVLTNLKGYYVTPQSLPLFGLSDHNTIMVSPRERSVKPNSRSVIYKQDSGPSCKAAMGSFLCSLDWPLLFNSLETCEDLMNVFQVIYQTQGRVFHQISKH